MHASYYGGSVTACHLDLIPYATACKWTELTSCQRIALLEFAGDSLGLLLRDSPVRLLILNGAAVVNNLQAIARVRFESKAMDSWTLPRRSGPGVVGIAYRGVVRELAGVKLARPVYILGFNHNLQSSFGVTTTVKTAIRNWLASAGKELL
jgi:hypothetical protein